MIAGAPMDSTHRLPTSWQLFYNSKGRYRPFKMKFKTNKAKWAKQ